MANVYEMSFGKIYPLLVKKAVRKGRTVAEVNQVITWMTGYSAEEIEKCAKDEISYADFFNRAPEMNPDRSLITGVVCKVRVETIEDPLMQDIRRLDKLIDELAKGRPMEKILRHTVSAGRNEV
ncbi:MAG TPA: DUF2200 domain-containing protein [Candidatus Fusicatenibacter merdavium]|uniref:DUF2200 domain-containing protein n=1 Tax=Candidatus Fusicatenibacter merdavium TaxID=2838600 RepID=A0A9D2BIB4_9FIRM|nr:DUF2200 domain-containing protein [Candidatus Fusicatenibacter merdavium]